MNSKEYALKLIKEALEETATGTDSFDEFKSVARDAHKPINLGHSDYNPNPRMGFIYHGTRAKNVESIRTTGTSGSKEFFGEDTGQYYGRGVYAYIIPSTNYGDGTIVEFAVKPGAFDNFIIFPTKYTDPVTRERKDMREEMYKRGFITRRHETVSENIRRLVDDDMVKYLMRHGIDVTGKTDYIDQGTFYTVMTRGERRLPGGCTTEERLDTTNIDGWCVNIGGPAVVVRRMDILIPNRIKMRGSDTWEYAIRSEKEFDNLNLYFDAHARVKGEYPDTSLNQKPSAGFILVGNHKKGNLINLRTSKYISAVPLTNCTSFSRTVENGFKVARFDLNGTSFLLRTPDEGKTVQVLYLTKVGELIPMDGGLDTLYTISELGINGEAYETIMKLYPNTNFNQPVAAGMMTLGDENNGNFLDIKAKKFFMPLKAGAPLKSCSSFTKVGGWYEASFTFANNPFKVLTNGGIANCSVQYFSKRSGGMEELKGGYEGFLQLVSTIMKQVSSKKPVNESFMPGTFDDFMNKEIPNTVTQYHGTHPKKDNFSASEHFINGIKNGKNIYFYTCSEYEKKDSMLMNGASYEFTGTSGDSTTFQGVAAYGAFSLAGAKRNSIQLGYGDTIYKFVLKDDITKYIIFDPSLRKALLGTNESLSQQVRRMCGNKKYKGRLIIDILEEKLRTPVGSDDMRKYYGDNKHLYHTGVNGLDSLNSATQGDAAAAFFGALKGSKLGMLNKATLWDEGPLNLMGVHGYIYNGGNHWDCICVRNFNALIPVAYTTRAGRGSFPCDENGHIIWTTNPYMTKEWFDKLNDNVTARFQYGAEYPDTNLKNKQSFGYMLVNGTQGYNFMDVRTHRHLLPIDVQSAFRFTEENGRPTTSFQFANTDWRLFKNGDKFEFLMLKSGKTLSEENFMQLIQMLIQKGAKLKIHPDAIIGGSSTDGVLSEGRNMTVKKGLRGGIDNLLSQEQRINEKGETLFGSEQVSWKLKQIAHALQNGDKKIITKAKEALLRMFEDDNLASVFFTNQEAREFAAFSVYGNKSPIEYNLENNRYYQITSKMVSKGSQKSDTQIAIEFNQEQKQKGDQKALKNVKAQKVESLKKVDEIIKNSGFKNFYLRGNVIYMFILNKKGLATEKGWEEWTTLKRKLSFAGYVTTTPMTTSIKMKSGNIRNCVYVNVDREEDLKESIEVHTAKEPNAREYTTQADFPKLKKCSKCGKDSFFLMTISDKRAEGLKDGEQDKDVIGTLDENGKWEPTEYQAVAVYKCPHCFHMDTLNNMA
jgi:hypothetical protein